MASGLLCALITGVAACAEADESPVETYPEVYDPEISPPSDDYVTIVPPPAYDPSSPPQLTDEEWRAVADREPFERKAAREPEDYRAPVKNPSAEGLYDSLSTIAWVFIIVLLAAGLAYAIYRYRRKPDLSISRRDYSATDTLLDTAPDALAADLASKLGKRDYRMAIRLRFGQVLQELRSRRLLVWVPGSTNLDYERGLPDYLRADFAALAADFAYATYAGKALDEARFERFADKANRFLLVAYGPADPRRAAAVNHSAG